MIPDIIETERLRLEPATPEYVDVHEAYRICSSDDGIEEVTEFLPWDPHPHPKETQEFLERCAEQRADHENADYVVRTTEDDGNIAGFGGLNLDWDRRLGELGLWLRKRYWGRGYSAERALALAELAFERLDLEVVCVTHHVDNEKSRRSIEKYIDRMGGRREGVIRNARADPDGGEAWNEVRYSVSQAEFREADPDREVTFRAEGPAP